ncbi:metallopeptidase, family M24 (plasmid) [Phaeobacter porticola]|uniref:Metallopeptidase, family M24 n=2 Tax=Phaeobacter porticola TaxID=1844006 RepID=A0A1L3I9R8_9RHOB|nr:metallopeptidase, family M24 [Phaeobacter porticola]
MVVSIEPGYYEAERFGIRIENVFEIVEKVGGFLAFRNMTLGPIQAEMLIPARISGVERAWLNAYHDEVSRKLWPLLSRQARHWLSSVTAPV